LYCCCRWEGKFFLKLCNCLTQIHSRISTFAVWQRYLGSNKKGQNTTKKGQKQYKHLSVLIEKSLPLISIFILEVLMRNGSEGISRKGRSTWSWLLHRRYNVLRFQEGMGQWTVSVDFLDTSSTR
jgi:hypothetical protein